MFSDKALKLILDEEGLDQPGAWPGESSGITIGIGYDLRYESNFANDWKPYLTPDEIARLSTVLGKQGSNELAKQFKDIKVTREASMKVFNDKTLPEYIRQTREAFPGFDSLPLDAQGALVSLVYNRGAGMAGDTRLEMRNIKGLVLDEDLQGIGFQIRAMKRLWPDKSGVDLDLRNRRDHEANLVESCIQAPIVSEPEPISVSEPVEQPKPTGILSLILNILSAIFKKK